MKTIMRFSLCLIIGILLSSCTSFVLPPQTDDISYAQGFIQRIHEADYVVVIGEMCPPESNRNEYVRFTLKTPQEKEVLKDFLSNLVLRFDKESTTSRRDGAVCGCAIWGKITNHFIDQEEYFTFLGEGLISENKAVFATDNEDYDPNEIFMTLTHAGVPYEHLEYPKSTETRQEPPKYRPAVIQGKWHTEDDELIVEFLANGTFKIHKAPMNFVIHLRKVPDRYKTFHFVAETSEWEMLSPTRMAIVQSYTFKSAGAIDVIRLDANHLDLQRSNYPITNLIRKK